MMDKEARERAYANFLKEQREAAHHYPNKEPRERFHSASLKPPANPNPIPLCASNPELAAEIAGR